MGLMAPIYQLSPNADSLRSWTAGPSSSQLFSYLHTFYHVFLEKSNVFLSKNPYLLGILFVKNLQELFFRALAIDKRGCVWLNIPYIICENDSDGKLALF